MFDDKGINQFNDLGKLKSEEFAITAPVVNIKACLDRPPQ
jgi:hypothetical protein